jgi:2-phospho-L-lactate guanylyltransferase (CobY/MobA/RfbA family)
MGHVRPRHVERRSLSRSQAVAAYAASVPTIVIPYRGDAKRRLPGELRAAVALALLGDVVDAALPLGRVLVVTDDPSVVPPGAEALADPGGGQGAAVAAGLAGVDGHALVVNSDLPLATTEALRRLAAAGLALVESADGTTNALSLPDPTIFAPLYGPRSAARFRAHALFATLAIPELEEDVDSFADFERLALRAGPRTRTLLAVRA